jgi:hypothetical protein
MIAYVISAYHIVLTSAHIDGRLEEGKEDTTTQELSRTCYNLKKLEATGSVGDPDPFAEMMMDQPEPEFYTH